MTEFYLWSLYNYVSKNRRGTAANLKMTESWFVCAEYVVYNMVLQGYHMNQVNEDFLLFPWYNTTIQHVPAKVN